eukprot:CAMPEP_0174973844 /NCGR_PEP_ID=MMETSP0004_2-20121128/11475_1 /TAXON_ID=420556 /ORGANISM="Ochromonas sp., Strain CCMP1393" /LENGTH=67 /DNA_ID=CAMNT_0016224353 /DNA_START=490 /DNA_END=693 /DNA_ORIENTATION=+
MATDVMLQAHNNGYAVAGEWMKEVAEEYCSNLLNLGLLAEVVASKDIYGSSGGDNSGGGGGDSSTSK